MTKHWNNSLSFFPCCVISKIKLNNLPFSLLPLPLTFFPPGLHAQDPNQCEVPVIKSATCQPGSPLTLGYDCVSGKSNSIMARVIRRTDGRMYGRMYGRRDRETNTEKIKWMSGAAHSYDCVSGKSKSITEDMIGRTDGRTDGRADGRTERQRDWHRDDNIYVCRSSRLRLRLW